MKRIVEKYIPKMCSGENPVVIKDMLWCDIIGNPTRSFPVDYMNVLNKYQSWKQVLKIELGLSVWKNPNWPNDKDIAIVQGTKTCFAGDDRTAFLEIIASPLYKSGRQLSHSNLVSIDNVSKTVVFEVDSNKIRILETNTDQKVDIDWSDVGVDPVIADRYKFTKDLSANITISEGDVTIEVDGKDILEMDKETQAEFVSLLMSLYTKDKGYLYFPGLNSKIYWDDPGNVDYVMCSSSDSTQIGLSGNDKIVAKFNIDFSWRGFVIGKDSGLPQQTYCKMLHIGCDTGGVLVTQSYYINVKFGVEDEIRCEVSVPATKFAVNGICVVGP